MSEQPEPYVSILFPRCHPEVQPGPCRECRPVTIWDLRAARSADTPEGDR